MNLNGKLVLLTGGTRMGLAIGEALGRCGARLLLTFRSSKTATEKIVTTLRQKGITIDSLRCDVTQPAQLKTLTAILTKREKRLDAVIHLASVYEKTNALAKDAMAAIDANFKVHARSAYELAHHLTPLMRQSGGGRFVFISDWTVSSRRPRYKGFAPYYISKMAVEGVIESLALELAPDILVNGIAPGPILPVPGTTRAAYREAARATPLQRWGGPQEIAKAVCFLMDSDFVTGETIRVDGGRHLN